MRSAPREVVLSAALALVRGDGPHREVLLIHPGGPFWSRRSSGAWSLPKGQIEAGEDALTAALREFAEETGHPAPPGPYVDLGEITQRSGKRVHGFAARGDLDAARIHSNEVEIEHPRGSGRRIRFPEVDRGTWVDLERGRALLIPAQVPLLERAMAAEV